MSALIESAWRSQLENTPTPEEQAKLDRQNLTLATIIANARSMRDYVPLSPEQYAEALRVRESIETLQKWVVFNEPPK